MTNLLSLWIGGIIVLGLVLDAVFLNGFSALFLARKFVVLIEWLAFWR